MVSTSVRGGVDAIIRGKMVWGNDSIAHNDTNGLERPFGAVDRR